MRLKNDLIEVYGKYAVNYNKANGLYYLSIPAKYLKMVGAPRRMYIYRVGDTLRCRPDNTLTQLIVKLSEYELDDEIIGLINSL